MMIERLLSDTLTQKFVENEFQDCFLVDIKVVQGNKVHVFVDSDQALTIDRCRQISRYLEKQIEEKNWLGEKYVLEVSSPGLDRPLKLHRQYVKNIGRKIRVKTTDGDILEGVLKNASVESIWITTDKETEAEIEFDIIDNAKILVSFK